MNIPTKSVVRGSEESSQPLRSRRQMFKGQSTSVAQFPAPFRNSSRSTTVASLGDDHPRTHIRTRLQKRNEDVKMDKTKAKAKRQRTSMVLDTERKRHSTRLLDKEIAAKKSPEDTDAVDSYCQWWCDDVRVEQLFLQDIGILVEVP